MRIWIGDDGLDSRDDEYGRLRYLQMSEEKQGACNTNGRRDMAKSSDHEEDVDI